MKNNGESTGWIVRRAAVVLLVSLNLLHVSAALLAPAQRTAMIALCNSFSSSRPINWNCSAPEDACDVWSGVICAGSDIRDLCAALLCLVLCTSRH